MRTTVDRVVASLDGTPLTESDVEREYKLEVFLEKGMVPDRVPDRNTFNSVLNRLIDQRLLAGQLESDGLAKMDVRSAVTERLMQLRRRFANGQAFQAALHSLALDENRLRAILDVQQRILQMTEQRFRPDAKPSQSEIETYYRTVFLPEFARNVGGSAPPLNEVDDRIAEILVQKKTGELVEAWVRELRAAHRIKMLPEGG